MMTNGMSILGLMQELRDMPEYKLYLQLDELNISIFIFDRNFIALQSLINFLAEDPRADELHILRNRDKLSTAMRDVLRHLHNFVAAALSLIDHTRRQYQKLYGEQKQFPEYLNRIREEFTEDPLAQFVKYLRQYCQHYKAPNLAVTTSFKAGMEKPIRTFNLLKEDLITYDGWNSVSRQYLQLIEREANILDIGVQYRKKVIRFYRWFQQRQAEIHADEIQKFRQKEAVLLRLMLEQHINMAFSKSEQGIPNYKDEIFTSIFTSAEFDELEQIPHNSSQRPIRAIELLEERFFTIPDVMKQRIQELYQIPDLTFEANDTSRDL